MAADLAAIRRKVRRLTRSPSEQQISDAEIEEYIATFMLYDFPAHIKTFSLRKKFDFVLSPFRATYNGEPEFDFTRQNYLDTAGLGFINQLVAIHQPMYVDGRQIYLSQSQEEFRNIYPQISTSQLISTTDGATLTFSGTARNTPILPTTVVVSFDIADDIFSDFVLADNPTGVTDGNLSDLNTVTMGTINYQTGVFSIDYTPVGPPPAGGTLRLQYYSYEAGRPQAALWFDNKFTFRPVPDRAYLVEVEADVKPEKLLLDIGEPEVQQWWQYIAYGAAKKIFEDRSDLESVQKIMPEFKKQENLVLRRTIVNQTKERSSTIYSQQTSNISYPWGWWNSNF